MAKEDKKADEKGEKVENESGDEELTEAEEEFPEESFGAIPESDIEVSDFSIGDIGLATANVETSWKGSLESSLAEEPQGDWEAKDEEREDDSDKDGVYSASSLDEDYDAGEIGRGLNSENKGGDLYDPSSGAYDVNPGEKLRDIKTDKGEKKFWGETRLQGMSRLENKSMKEIGGVFAEGYRKKVGKNEKYN